MRQIEADRLLLCLEDVVEDEEEEAVEEEGNQLLCIIMGGGKPADAEDLRRLAPTGSKWSTCVAKYSRLLQVRQQ